MASGRTDTILSSYAWESVSKGVVVAVKTVESTIGNAKFKVYYYDLKIRS